MTRRSIATLASVIAGWMGLSACGLTTALDDAAPSTAALGQPQTVWAAGTQPNLKGAYWLKLDDNYSAIPINDNRRVAWNLETPGFGGYDAAAVAALFTNHQIQTLIRIGDVARPSAADLAALSAPSFSCSSLSAAWLSALDAEAARVDATIADNAGAIGGFIFGNEPNVPAPIEWGIGGAAYARAYNCYLTRWRASAKSRFPLLAAGPGGCGGFVPLGCAAFYADLFTQLGAAVDGFAIHAYGTSTFVTGTDLQGFADQVDRINAARPGRPIHITEFAVGGNQSPATGWADYFNQRLDDVRTFNQTHGGQVKSLIYFVDALLGVRRGSCAGRTTDPQYLTSLCDPATRAAWRDSASALVSAPAQPNQADLVEGLSSVPVFQMPGQVAQVSLLARNPGGTTWPGTGSASAYRLGAHVGNGVTFSAFPQCGGFATSPADARVYTCAAVPPGGSYTYQLLARAPTNNVASTALSVRMVQDGAQWFGYGARFPIGLGAASCGTAVTQCILYHRPDILPVYAANGWTTTCPNRDAIIDNWCASADPSACSALKAGACSSFNSACRCSGGVHLGGASIDRNTTFCGYQVCGQDRNVYSCQATGWSNTRAACN